MQIVGALRIHAFMDNEMFSVFFRNQSVAAMRTSQFYGRESAFIRRESGIADLTQELAFGTVVLVEKRFRGIAAGTGAGKYDQEDFSL